MQASQGKEPERRDETGPCESLVFVTSAMKRSSFFKPCLQSDPKSTTLLLELAETQRRKGDINTAIDTFRARQPGGPERY
jgi:hypothetical protein